MIWKSFSFHFIQIKKTSQHFRNLGCKIKILDVDEKYKNILQISNAFIFLLEIIIFVIKWFKNKKMHYILFTTFYLQKK